MNTNCFVPEHFSSQNALQRKPCLPGFDDRWNILLFDPANLQRTVWFCNIVQEEECFLFFDGQKLSFCAPLSLCVKCEQAATDDGRTLTSFPCVSQHPVGFFCNSTQIKTRRQEQNRFGLRRELWKITSPMARMKKVLSFLLTAYVSVPVVLYLFPWILSYAIFSHLCK